MSNKNTSPKPSPTPTPPPAEETLTAKEKENMLRYGNKNGPVTKLPTAMVPTPQVLTAKQERENMLRYGTKTGPVKPAKPVQTFNQAAEEIAVEAWKPVLSLGQSVIDTLMMPGYFIQGQILRSQQLKDEDERAKKAYKEGLEAAARSSDPNAAINFMTGKSGKLDPNAFKTPKAERVDGYSNATSWMRGERPKTGNDILLAKLGEGEWQNQNVTIPGLGWEINLPALGVDFATDPTVLFGGKLVTIPGKIAVDVAKGAVKGAKKAILEGEVTANTVNWGVKDLAERAKNIKENPNVTPLKPNSSVLNQYTSRPIIKENLKRTTGPAAEVLTALDSGIANKLVYNTVKASPTVTNVLASALELGYKSAASRVLQDLAKNDLQRIVRNERVVAKKTSNATSKANKKVQTVESAAYAAMNSGKVQELEQLVPHISDDGIHVLDGDKLRPFKTEADAQAWVNQKNGVAPETPVKTTNGLPPVVDAAPDIATATQVVLNAPVKASIAKDAKSFLANIEKLSKKTKGISSTENVFQKIGKIVNRADGNIPVPKDARTTLNQVVKNNANVFTALENLKNTKGASDIRRILLERELRTQTGKRPTLQNLIDRKITWEQLGKDGQAQVKAIIKELLSPQADAVKSKLNSLIELVGEDIANKIAATGILEGKAVNAAAIKDLLKDIPELQTRTYGSFAELITGLRKGDQVDVKALEKLVQAIDPENTAIKQAVKTLSSADAYSQLSEILMGKGVRTVADAARRLDMVNATTLMKAQGVSFADALALYTEQRLTGSVKPSSAAVDESRAAASLDLAKMNDSSMVGQVNRTLESINAGFNGTYDYLARIEQSPDFLTEVTSTGELATRSTTDAYQAETRAMLLRQLTASFEARMLGNMFGLIRNDLSFVKTKIGKKTVSTKVNPTPEALLKEFLIRGQIADTALLSILGGRITWRKVASAAAGEKHFVYASTAQFAKIVDETGGTEVLLRALFPDVSKGLLKTDALSTYAISKTIRHILETEEQGLAHSIKELAGKEFLKSRGAEQAVAWSKPYKDQVDEITTQLAEHLTRPEVIRQFQELHKNRAIAAIEDIIPESNAISEDLWGSLIEAMKANRLRGLESTADNSKEIREWFNKFVYASGIFHHQDSEIARSVFQSAVMLFMRNGRLEKLASDAEASMALVGGPRARLEADRTLFQEITDELNRFFERQNNDNVVNIDANVKPFPKKEEISAATDKLTEAKSAYAAHIAARETQTTKAQMTAWVKRFNKLQENLNVARKTAQSLGIQTHHWLGGDWVPAAQYDYAAAKLAAEKAGDGTMNLPDGAVKATVVDTPSSLPTPRAVVKEKAAALQEKWKNEVAVRNQELMAGKHEEIAADILARQDEFTALGFDEVGTATRMYQETIARVYSDSVIEVTLTGSVERGKWAGVAGIENPVIQTGQQAFAERWNATSGQWNLRPTLSAAESRIHTRVHGLADAAHSIQRKYSKGANKLDYDQILEGTRLAMSRVTPGPEVNPIVAAFANDVRRLLDPIFGDKNVSEITSAGISPAALTQAFNRFGLSEQLGFKFPGTGVNPGELHKLPEWVPFSQAPDGAKPGSAPYKQWEDDVAKFKESGVNPLTGITRLAQAVEFAKTEHTLVNDFVSRFGYKAQGMTREQAIKQGWVSIKGVSAGGTDLTELIRPEAGGLFHPDIAREFLSLNREWNRLFVGNKMNGMVYGMMELTGVLKASQTILRLGHHAANIFGDFTTAMIVGLRNPMHVLQGIRLASTYASQDVLGLVGNVNNKLDRRLVRSMERIEGYTLPSEAWNNQTPSVSVTIMRNGKPTQVKVDFNTIKHMFEENNVLIGNIQANDIQGLNDTLSYDVGFGSLGARRKLGETILTGIRKGMRAATVVPGEATSYYSNIIRASHAMSVLQSRSWKSMNEAMNAVNETMNRFHPTIQSLAGGERTGARLMVTYYTWIRTAHNAFIDMAMNHTAAMMVPHKLIYNAATTAGLNPQSVGNPWDKEDLSPNYLNYATQGPTVVGKYGPTLVRPGFLSADVLDQWNFTYDGNRSLSENIVTNRNNLAKTLVSSGNAVALSLAEGAIPFSLKTFTPKTTDNVEEEVGSLIDQFGFTKLLDGLNLYTPQNKQVGNTLTPRTDEEREILLNNWLTGKREAPVYTKRNLLNAKDELRQRLIDAGKKAND